MSVVVLGNGGQSEDDGKWFGGGDVSDHYLVTIHQT